MKTTSFKSATLCVSTYVLYAFVYYVYRIPVSQWGLAYHDDGETLYHVLSILSGRIPYRDDFNHHFPGYIYQFVLTAKAFGFSLKLVDQTAILTQAGVGLGCFLCTRLLVGNLAGIAMGLAVVSARQPWVLGFQVQYQLNLLYVFALYFTLAALERRTQLNFLACCLLLGLTFWFDQRALFLSFLAICSGIILLRSDAINRQTLGLGLLIYLSPWILYAIYLYANSALTPFWEQTIVYPRTYRVGSFDTYSLFSHGLKVFTHLKTTPFLTLSGLLGLVLLLKHEQHLMLHKRMLLILLSTIPVCLMPLFGSRDFDYYSLSLLPHLGILAACGLYALRSHSTPMRCSMLLLILATPLISTAVLASSAASKPAAPYTGDGIVETVEQLNQRRECRESLFVWGYRLELYTRMDVLSALPFSSQIMIHPDGAIRDANLRRAHVYPKYRDLFLDRLEQDPPQCIVLYRREGKAELSSQADTAIKALVRDKYRREYHIRNADFTGKWSDYEIYLRTR